MAKATKRKSTLNVGDPSKKPTVGYTVWFTDPKTGQSHEGTLRGGRTVEEMTGFARITKQTQSGEEQVTGYEETITTWTVPASVVIHAGPRPTGGAK